MRIVLNALESAREPRIRVQHQQVLAMALQPGSIELGVRRSEMIRLTYDRGEMFLCHRHVELWILTDDLHVLSILISDAALTAASDGISGETELQNSTKLVDLRIAALARP